jgi:hypothetical protein
LHRLHPRCRYGVRTLRELRLAGSMSPGIFSSSQIEARRFPRPGVGVVFRRATRSDLHPSPRCWRCVAACGFRKGVFGMPWIVIGCAKSLVTWFRRGRAGFRDDDTGTIHVQNHRHVRTILSSKLKGDHDLPPLLRKGTCSVASGVCP